MRAGTATSAATGTSIAPSRCPREPLRTAQKRRSRMASSKSCCRLRRRRSARVVGWRSRNRSAADTSTVQSIRHGFGRSAVVGGPMLHMALVFLVIGIIAAVLGFTTIAGASFAVAKFLAGLFLILFLVFLIIGLSAARRIID